MSALRCVLSLNVLSLNAASPDIRPLNALLLAALLLAWAAPAAAAPIRVVSPGTGVFLGNVAVGRGLVAERSNDAAKVRIGAARTNAFYAPNASTLVGLSIPYVDKKLTLKDAGSDHIGGLGDVTLVGHWRFFDRPARGYRDMAAVRLALDLPTGSTDRRISLPVDEATRRALQPGSGGVGTTILAAVGRAHYRYATFLNLSWKHNTNDRGWRQGDTSAADIHAGVYLFPKQTRARGFEVYTAVESRLEHRERTRLDGDNVASSGGDSALAAPMLQVIFGARLVAELSVELPLWEDLNGEQPGLDYSVLFGLRFVP